MSTNIIISDPRFSKRMFQYFKSIFTQKNTTILKHLFLFGSCLLRLHIRIILYHFTEKESVKCLKWKGFGHPLAMKVVLPLIYLKKKKRVSKWNWLQKKQWVQVALSQGENLMHPVTRWQTKAFVDKFNKIPPDRTLLERIN